MMKKPIHPIALILWCVGAYCLLVGIPVNLAAHGNIGFGDSYMVTLLTMAVNNFWWALSPPLTTACLVIGLGTLVELVDQIRWNALPPEKRIIRHPIRAAIRYLRGRS